MLKQHLSNGVSYYYVVCTSLKIKILSCVFKKYCAMKYNMAYTLKWFALNLMKKELSTIRNLFM